MPISALTRRTVLQAATALASAAFTSMPSLAAFAKDGKLAALSPEHQKALRDIPMDPPPENLIQDQHFLVSDEHHPERFKEEMADLGGVYIGVGPEQNYLFAGWSKPEILVLLDFDQMVVDVHEIYRVFILACDTPEALVKMWHKDQNDLATAAIKKAVTDVDAQNNLLGVYRASRRPIYNRLNSLRIRYGAMKLPTFLNDQTQYDYVRNLFEGGRVRAVRGDLTKDQAMNGVAKAAKTLGVPVRCTYLSNVEQYFDYANGIGANCLAQPGDTKSKVLRTVYKGTSQYERYHYCVQQNDDFRAWLATDIKNLRDLMIAAYKRIKKTKTAWILPGPA